mgnify:CR=1 FL=1
MHKFVLSLCIQNSVLGLGWLGRIAHHGMISCHLGNLIGVEISHVKLTEWVSKKLEDKIHAEKHMQQNS